MKNMNLCFSSRRKRWYPRSLDAGGFLAEAPQESSLQFEESAASNSVGDLSVSCSNTSSSSDSYNSDPLKEKEKEGTGDAQVLKDMSVSGGISVAIISLAGPIMNLFKKLFNKNDDTPVPDAGAQKEVLQAPARGALNRGGQAAQEGAHQSSRSFKGALALQNSIS
jgi:hypothetical protein